MGVVMTLRFQKLSIALPVAAVLACGMMLSACGTIAGAGQDVSNIGHDVTGGARQVQRGTNAP
jgi:predicted small secreted protein